MSPRSHSKIRSALRPPFVTAWMVFDFAPPPIFRSYLAASLKLYGDQAEGFLALYPAGNDAEAMGLLAAREGPLRGRHQELGLGVMFVV